MDRDELGAWLRLVATRGVGRGSARLLLAAFGDPRAIFRAPRSAVQSVVSPVVTAALEAKPPELEGLIDRTLDWLGADSASRQVVTLADADYPRALLNTADPPLLLHVEGALAVLQMPLIAMVGSRHATAQGLDHARSFGEALSRAGHPVVSGLALGIDGAAHAGSLDGGGGTVAVVGTGLDQVYPRRHAALAHRILGDPAGAIVSEYVLGTPPLPAHFPQRNRIIAGLALGTLVVEAAPQSGSLITARLAAESGREVFAIPGSIAAPQSRGCHALIRDGAKLVETPDDVLEEFRGQVARPATVTVPAAACSDDDDDPLLAALGHDPVSLDALVARTGESAATLSVRLLELELEGRVARLPGQLFQRRAAA